MQSFCSTFNTQRSSADTVGFNTRLITYISRNCVLKLGSLWLQRVTETRTSSTQTQRYWHRWQHPTKVSGLVVNKPVSHTCAVAGHWTTRLKSQLLLGSFPGSSGPLSREWAMGSWKRVEQQLGFLTTGQSNLADRMEDWSIGQSVVVWVRKPNFWSFCCDQPFVCQVWLSSGPPEFFTSSYCAWLWNWLVEQSSILSAKFDCPVACQNV